MPLISNRAKSNLKHLTLIEVQSAVRFISYIQDEMCTQFERFSVTILFYIQKRHNYVSLFNSEWGMKIDN